jgi:hypothetical protein
MGQGERYQKRYIDTRRNLADRKGRKCMQMLQDRSISNAWTEEYRERKTYQQQIFIAC